MIDHFQALSNSGHTPSKSESEFWLGIIANLPRETALNFLVRNGMRALRNEEDSEGIGGPAFLDEAIWHMFDQCERRSRSGLDFTYLTQLFADAVPHLLLEHIGAWCENDAMSHDPLRLRTYRYFYRHIVNPATASVRFMDCIFKQLHSASVARTLREEQEESGSDREELNVRALRRPALARVITP